MKRRFRFTGDDELQSVSEINLTPLMDLAFALLIIFMLTAPLMRSALDIDLPKSATVGSANASVQAILAMDKSGNYFFQGQPVNLKALPVLLEDYRQTSKTQTIELQADKVVPYQKIVETMDLLRAAQLNQIAFSTRNS